MRATERGEGRGSEVWLAEGEECLSVQLLCRLCECVRAMRNMET